MSARKIERIRLTNTESFFLNYVLTRTPVIITNLFEGQPIRAINTHQEALRVFNDVAIDVQTEYSAAAARPDHATRLTMKFGEYSKYLHANPDTDLLCTEYEIPARIMMLFKLPSLCLSADLAKDEILGMPRKYGDHDLSTNLFVANRGNRAHLHFDGDHRQVLLYQVFGRKEIVLFEPESSGLLKTLEGTPWSAGVFLENMTREEKHELLDAANGYYEMLHPGEAIYMPMLVWHYLEYTDHAMSLNLRFNRNCYGRFLCVDNFHRDNYLQNFAAQLAGNSTLPDQYEAAMREVIFEYVRPAPSLREKVRRMRRLLCEVCQQLLPQIRAAEFCPPHYEEQEIDKILQDIGQTSRYASPESVALARPTGKITPVQKQTIERNAKRCGYDEGTLCHLLMNRLGKSGLNDLSITEAIQFMSYMRSPGATWLPC